MQALILEDNIYEELEEEVLTKNKKKTKAIIQILKGEDVEINADSASDEEEEKEPDKEKIN